jgi:hypothetical protein
MAEVFEHLGGAGQPDFLDEAGLGYELTTDNPATLAYHLRRSYVSEGRLATYGQLGPDFRFTFQGGAG